MLLSNTEAGQIGTGDYIRTLEDWNRFRSLLVEKSAKRNPDHFDPGLAAYTPGETEKLLDDPVISDWHKQMAEWTPPAGSTKIILVPCAASKPWRDHKRVRKSMLYKAYNQLAQEHPDWCFVTISEPLGIVPFSRWDSFPHYDNPGLFKDDFLRTGLVKSEWKDTFLGERRRLPFDDAAFERCIGRLVVVITAALSRTQIPIFAFVDAPGKHTTHGRMLDVVQQSGINIRRFPKKAKARTTPYAHIQDSVSTP